MMRRVRVNHGTGVQRGWCYRVLCGMALLLLSSNPFVKIFLEQRMRSKRSHHQKRPYCERLSRISMVFYLCSLKRFLQTVFSYVITRPWATMSRSATLVAHLFHGLCEHGFATQSVCTFSTYEFPWSREPRNRCVMRMVPLYVLDKGPVITLEKTVCKNLLMEKR